MKTIFLIIAVLASIFTAKSQNPYEQFGVEGRLLLTEYERSGGNFHKITFEDSSSEVYQLEFDFKNFTFEVSDGSGNIVSAGKLSMTKPKRWMSRDPLASSFTGLSPYNAFLNNPIYIIDPGGDSSFVFEDKGEFIGEKNDGKEIWSIEVISSDMKHNDQNKNNSRFFIMNDQKKDPDRMRKMLDITKKTNEVLVPLSFSKIEEHMALSGVNEDRSFSNSMKYALIQSPQNESREYGKMDYRNYLLDMTLYYDLSKEERRLIDKDIMSPFYLTPWNKSYNSYDAGNMEWGYGISKLGINLGIGSLGATFNELMNNRQYWGGNEDPNDQQAIFDGHGAQRYYKTIMEK